VYRADKDGRYIVRTVAPIGYSIPLDGPVGDLVTRTGVSPYRPTHVHFDVSADGFSPVITHIFRKGVPHLDDDVVFAVKDRLIVDFVEHGPGVAPNGERMTVPYCTAQFDFVLAAARAAALA
jgi:hydroxyquinol 1,2-dioxygenase